MEKYNCFAKNIFSLPPSHPYLLSTYLYASLSLLQLNKVQGTLESVQEEAQSSKVELASAREELEERERVAAEQCQAMEGRVGDLQQQNKLLYEEAEKVRGLCVWWMSVCEWVWMWSCLHWLYQAFGCK